MQVHFQSRTGSVSRPCSLYFLLSPLQISSSYHRRFLTSTAEMVADSGSSKRPMCPKCSKPSRICLCTRLKTPSLENSVAVTILQHSLEKKHPLNSTRIASLGLANLSIFSVSDVNFQARFVIDFLYPGHQTGSGHFDGKSSDFGATETAKRKWDCVQESILCSGWDESSDFGKFLQSPEEKMTIFADSDKELSKRIDLCSVTDSGSESFISVTDRKSEAFITKTVSGPYFIPIGAVSGRREDAVVDFTVEKYGVISSCCKELHEQKNFDELLASAIAGNSSGKGFTVNKFQRKKLDESGESEEFEEFKVEVPPGSVLLFPSEKSVGIDAIDFEVKNLIVLDGTWAKAKRMYNENPWLKFLPHLKLDLDELSLYSEVRHQPKAGCLSTIESIVYALKALGEDSEKLDGLLEVFKSMVGDQRRCKDERLSKVSVKPSQSHSLGH